MKEPNKELLTSWLDGKLEEDELRQMEAWAMDNAGDLDNEFKCDIGWDALNDDYMASVPKSEEPPYPEFFNSKLEQAIMAEPQGVEVSSTSAPVSVTGSLWQKLGITVMPAAVAAAVAFYAGMQMKATDRDASELMVEVIYVPDENVQAEVSDNLEVTEIVLDGLTPISDDFDMNVSSVPAESDAGVFRVMVSQDGDNVFY